MTNISENDVFYYAWRIENFSMCPLKCKEFLRSPVFVVDVAEKTSWEMLLYPKGDSLYYKDSISCYLHRTNNTAEPEEITIGWVMKLGTTDMKWKTKKGKTFRRGCGWGDASIFSRKILFEKKSVFLPNDVLTLHCYIWRVSEGKEIKLPYFSLGTTISLEETFSVFSDDSMTPEQYPTQCCACTRIPIERRQITWTINDFKAKSSRRMHVSVASALREKSMLLLSCYVEGDWNRDGRVRIDIQRKDRDMMQMLVRCKVSVLDQSDVALESEEDEHLFGGDYEVWSFPPIIKLSHLLNYKRDLLEDGALCMRCNFLISYEGEQFASGGVINLQTRNLIQGNGLRSDITKLLKDQELTDVTLICEDDEVNVHKAVICARSPVFLAMFSGDTEEKRTGVVRITDIDAETLKIMRSFLYDDHLFELEAVDAFKLYSAADKYQILTLKKLCTSCLKYNLSLSNVCDVLVLADMHQDSGLLKSVYNFLRFHSEEIFESKEWMKLMEDNILCAGETMRKILLKRN